MDEKLETLRTSLYLSNRQDPELLRILREIPTHQRSKWLRDASNHYIHHLDAQLETEPLEEIEDREVAAENPSPLDELLNDVEEPINDL